MLLPGKTTKIVLVKVDCLSTFLQCLYFLHGKISNQGWFGRALCNKTGMSGTERTAMFHQLNCDKSMHEKGAGSVSKLCPSAGTILVAMLQLSCRKDAMMIQYTI